MYLEEIGYRTHDCFVGDTISTCKKRMNGINDKRIFNEIVKFIKDYK